MPADSDRVDVAGRMVRCANRRLRAAPLLIADNLLSVNNYFRAQGALWKQRRVDHRLQRVRVAKRFSRLAYAMLAGRQIVPARSVADPGALRTAYRKGRVNAAGGSLRSIPIIDGRPYRDLTGDIHDRIRTFVTEARLARAHSGTKNRVVLTNYGTHVNLIEQMDEWLTNIAQDTAAGTTHEKIARNKPEELHSACWTAEGQETPEAGKDSGRCSEIYPTHGDPRLVAGAPLANDILKCALKPVEGTDYEHPMTEAQIDRLKKIFSSGVCDYTRPGVEQSTPAGVWLRYGN